MPVHSKPFASTCLPLVVPGPWQIFIDLLSWTSIKPHQFAAAIAMAHKMHLLKTFRQFQPNFTHWESNAALCGVEGILLLDL